MDEDEQLEELLHRSRTLRDEAQARIGQGAQGEAVELLGASFEKAALAVGVAGKLLDAAQQDQSGSPALRADVFVSYAETAWRALGWLSSVASMLELAVTWKPVTLPLATLNTTLAALVTAEIRARGAGSLAHAARTMRVVTREACALADKYARIFAGAQRLEELNEPTRVLARELGNLAVSAAVAFNILELGGVSPE